MPSSNQDPPWEPALPNKVEPALELFTHRKISLTSGNCICSTNIVEKNVAGRQSLETVVYSLNKAFSLSRQPSSSFLYFYNESTSICSILVRCRNYVPYGNRKTSRVWSWGLIDPWAREAAAQRYGCWTAWQRQSIQGALRRDHGHFLCIWSREIGVVLSGTNRMLIWANELCGTWLPSGWQRTASG